MKKRNKKIFWIVGGVAISILILGVVYFFNVVQTIFPQESIPSEIARVINP